MGIYANHILPRLVDRTCGAKATRQQRQKIVPLAEGVVLEVGIGSGHNLGFYDAGKVTVVKGLEPSEAMLDIARARAAETPFEVEFIVAPGEAIPLDDDSIDCVLITYTLCTIPDPAAALRECHRVLRPDGKLLYLEHGQSPDRGRRRWQGRVNPIWRRLSGGCNINKPIPAMIEAAGFKLNDPEAAYVAGKPKIIGYEFLGVATPVQPS